MENKIIKGLPKTFEVVERESAEFPLEVRDPNTPVDIFVNGENIKDMTPAGRMELENKGNGKFLLKVHKWSLDDDGVIEMRTPSNRDVLYILWTVSCPNLHFRQGHVVNPQ